MQIPFQQIVEGLIVIFCSVILFLKNNGIIKEIKLRNYHRLEKKFEDQRLDLLKITIYLDSIPLIDKLYNFNEYIANGGNHGVIEHMKPIILYNKEAWWNIYEREKRRGLPMKNTAITTTA
ncbi:MAG: hypothetical protein LBU85_02960 [Treponema sp.]|jgi:hypothetical protein|nr:hypothetical protein [Treponema sp.]